MVLRVKQIKVFAVSKKRNLKKKTFWAHLRSRPVVDDVSFSSLLWSLHLVLLPIRCVGGGEVVENILGSPLLQAGHGLKDIHHTCGNFCLLWEGHHHRCYIATIFIFGDAVPDIFQVHLGLGLTWSAWISVNIIS